MDISSSVVFEHDFDQDMLDQIDTLRTIRLNLAETMLKDLAGTAEELAARGLTESDTEVEEVKAELVGKIGVLRERLKRRDVVYADEISLYLELVEKVENDELNLLS